MSKTIYIGGRLESKEKGNVVTGANAILDDTKGKKQNVINKETDDELARLEQSKQDNLNFDNTPTEDSTNPVTSGGVYTAEKALSDAIEAILLLIPSAATALNKLVDTNTMNSSISTATATFRGTYNAVSDLGLTYQATHAQIEAALDALGLTADNNDFAFVQIPVSDQSQDIAKTERFKFNGTNWLYEYDLNTSGFTAAQWAAINSGITVALVTKLTDLPTAAALQLALNAKQDTLTFDNEPTALSQNPVTSGGIYLAIQAVATALSNYSNTTDGRLNTLEGLIPTEASSSNKLTDKAYVDGLIQAITELIPAEASSTNQLADKAYMLAQILAATPAFKGQFTTLAELQAVASPKAGDLGIVRTKDSDGMDVFTVYQYLNNAWNVFYSLSYHPQTKPATTGTTGDYPYNGMGRVELAMNMVNTGTELAPVMVNQLTQDMFYKGAVGSRVQNTNTIFVIRYDYVLAENITIPDNCVLEFEGGSISGAYLLTGSNTSIQAGKTKIFGDGLTLGGKYNCQFNVYWWGLKGDRTNAVSPTASVTGNDNSPYIENMLAALYTIGDNGSNEGGVTIFFPRGYYYFSREIVVAPVGKNFRNWGYNKTYEICGESKNETALVWDNERGMSNTTRMLDLYIHDLSFINVAADVRGRFNAVADKETYVSNGYAIKVLNPEYTSKIENCYFSNWYSCIEINATYGQFTIDNCLTSRTIYGFVSLDSNGINFKTNSINFAYEAGIYAKGSLCYIDSICVEGAPFSNTDGTFPYADKFHSIGILSVGSTFSVNYSYFEFIYIGLYLKTSSYQDKSCDITLIYDYPQAIADKITNGDIVIDNIYYYNNYQVVVPSEINLLNTYPARINCNVIPPSAGTEWTFPKSLYYKNNWYYLCASLIITCNLNISGSTRDSLYEGNALPIFKGFYKGESKEFLAQKYIGGLTCSVGYSGGSDYRVLSTGRLFNSDTGGYVGADVIEIAKGVQIDATGVMREVLVTKKTDGTEVVQPTLQIGGNARPTNPAVGCQWFQNGKPIWWNGTNWVDATGATVS